MNKTSKIAILGSALAIVGMMGYSAYAAGNGEMLDSAVENGVISQEKADELRDFNQEQRKQEMQDRMEERITQGVEDGVITEDEAQEIRDWQDSKPEAMERLAENYGGFGKGGHKHGSESK